MFHPMKPETHDRHRRERDLQREEDRERFVDNVLACRRLYPQFAYPDTLPSENVLWLVNETVIKGPKGYPEAISIGSRVRYENAF